MVKFLNYIIFFLLNFRVVAVRLKTKAWQNSCQSDDNCKSNSFKVTFSLETRVLLTYTRLQSVSTVESGLKSK